MTEATTNIAPCKYFSSYMENQSPLGSGMYWPMEMIDCVHPGYPDDKQKQIIFENYPQCDISCPGYEPEPTLNCPKHGAYFGSEGCVECEYEAYFPEGQVENIHQSFETGEGGK